MAGPGSELLLVIAAENVQHDRPDDRDESMSPIGTNTVTLSDFHGASQDAMDAELGEAERTQPDDREDDRTYEQNLARRLHGRGYRLTFP